MGDPCRGVAVVQFGKSLAVKHQDIDGRIARFGLGIVRDFIGARIGRRSDGYLGLRKRQIDGHSARWAQYGGGYSPLRGQRIRHGNPAEITRMILQVVAVYVMTYGPHHHT